MDQMRPSAATRFRDHYAILGVPTDANEAEIKAAYRERAKQCHPDLHPGDAAAAERFRLISEARRVLLSPGSRSAFNLDRMEHELRLEIVSVVHFRRPRSQARTAPATPHLAVPQCRVCGAATRYAYRNQIPRSATCATLRQASSGNTKICPGDP